MTLGISTLFDEPFFSGELAFSPDTPSLFPVALAGHGYVAELALFQQQTVRRTREPFDASDEPGEHSLNTTGTWSRSASRWSRGAGQDFWDQFNSDRARFRASKGVDVFSGQHRVSLLPGTEQIRVSSNQNLKILPVGGYLYIVDGDDVLWTADPFAGTVSWTDANIEAGDAPGTVYDLTTNGTRVWAALGPNGIHYTTLGASSSTALSSFAATLAQYANGRLIAAASHVLAEIDAAGTAQTIKTHDNTAFAWTTVAGAPNGIYAGGNAGDRSEIYYIPVDTTTGGLAPLISVGALPDGETINTLVFYQGVALVGTSRGLRLAVVGTGNGLEIGPVIEIGPVDAIEPQAEFCWFSWRNYDSTATGLGRANLAEFTQLLVPAYASDLMAETQGDVPAIATFSDRRLFAVSASGIWREAEHLVASGTIDSGWVNQSTAERKIAISVDVRHEPLAGTVTVQIRNEEGSLNHVGISNVPGSLGPREPLGVGPHPSEQHEIRLVLARDSSDATKGPVVRRWTFRTLVTPTRVDQILLPIYLTETVEVTDPGGGHQIDLDPLEEFLFLKSLESSGEPVRLQLGEQTMNVYVEQVTLPEDRNRRWTSDRTFPQGLCFVHLVQLEPVA